MRVAIIYLVGALLLVGVGAALLATSRLDSALAGAQQDLWVEDYAAADAAFETAERFLGYAALVPGVGESPLEELQAKRAWASYWQRRYADLVAEDAQFAADDRFDSPAQQLVVAHAVYRLGQQEAIDEESSLAALDAAIDAYHTVLRQGPAAEDAAYNFEYLVRLRRTIQGGDGELPEIDSEGGSFGSEGGPQQELDDDTDFKVYIPLEGDEIDKLGGAAGKAAPREKKG